MDKLDKEIEECFKYVENLGVSDEAVILLTYYNLLEHQKNNTKTSYENKLSIISVQSDIMFKIYYIMKGRNQ